MATATGSSADIADKLPDMIYLDYNATTPLDPSAIEAMKESMSIYGNPSSNHIIGNKAKETYEQSRLNISKLINSNTVEEIIILSGGTESINYCLRGAALSAYERTGGFGNHIITSKIEHVAVLETIKYLVLKCGFEATYLPVDEKGQVLVKDVIEAIKPNTILCSIMHSNNEVGTINPIKEISQVLFNARVNQIEQENSLKDNSISNKQSRILFHSDTSQSLGKVEVDVQDLGIDYATITGHKIYAPKGEYYVYSQTKP